MSESNRDTKIPIVIKNDHQFLAAGNKTRSVSIACPSETVTNLIKTHERKEEQKVDPGRVLALNRSKTCNFNPKSNSISTATKSGI